VRAIVLAAGQGTRLLPLTRSVPKCMVPYKGRPIIDWVFNALTDCGIHDIAVVTGYRREVLEAHLEDREVRFHHNPDFAETNMVRSLFCAEAEMDRDLIVTYSDIVYRPTALDALLSCTDDLAIAVDREWRALWERRMPDPLQDAETLKLDEFGYVLELGKRPGSYDEIEGQYMGMIKFSRRALARIIELYREMDREALYGGKPFDEMHMTAFLQFAIDRRIDVRSVGVSGGWLEIDEPSDREIDMVQ
jgi:choline kinase